MNNVIKYASIYIDSEEDAIPFYTNYLNWTVYENVKLSRDEEWWILKNDEQDKLGLILIKMQPKVHHKSTLIINTPDCVLAYCMLKERDIDDLREPSYSSIGLSISFSDPSGNTIMLLEERKYNELEI